MHTLRLGLAAAMVAGLSAPVAAQDLKADIKFSETGVAVIPTGEYRNLTLSIIGPNEFQTSEFSKREGPAIDLRKVDIYDDGNYTFRVTAATDQIQPIRTGLNNGRDDIAKERFVTVELSGSFSVVRGKIVPPKEEEEEGGK
jgi:hypothetical protein